MENTTNRTGITQWLHLVFGAGLLLSFFLPWVSWDGMLVKGSAIATGDFFRTSVALSGPDNPFPALGFSFYLFWLIPILAALTVIFILLKKKVVPFSFIAGAMSLALITVYFLFSNTLTVDFSIGKNVWSMLKPSVYIHAFCAAGLITTAFPEKNWLPKLIWLLTGPVLAYGGYKMGEKYIMGERFDDTVNIKADYTVNSVDLIREFAANDTAANKKYREKILAVTGTVSQAEIKADSTVNIKLIDTTRHFLNFSLDKKDFLKTKSIKAGDNISLKGVCSGSDYSMILDSTSINFKRATLNKK